MYNIEVFIDNATDNRGEWITLPMSPDKLSEYLDYRGLRDDEGTYDMTSLRLSGYIQEPAVENLFDLNEKVSAFMQLGSIAQETLVTLAFKQGITIENVLFYFL